MAEGAHKIVTSTVSADATVEVGIPTGETWMITAYGSDHDLRLSIQNGNTEHTWLNMEGDRMKGSGQSFAQGVFLDENTGMAFENMHSGGSVGVHVSALEVDPTTVVIANGNISANSTVSVAVPAGEVWMTTAHGNIFRCALEPTPEPVTDRSWIQIGSKFNGSPDTDSDVHTSTSYTRRAIFDGDGTEDPQIRERDGIATGYYIAAKHL